jgi:prophage maintenance system killer protein
MAKDSSQFKTLLQSGTMWEKHYRPFAVTDRDRQFEFESQHLIRDLEGYRLTKPLDHKALRRLFPDMAHQMVTTETASPLTLGETKHMYMMMKQSGFINRIETCKHLNESFPDPSDLAPASDAIRVAEMRNQLIALHASSTNLSWDFTENGIRNLHRAILCGTPMEHTTMWGKEQRAGEYRIFPVQAKGYPLTIYPYPQEIPALMRRFVDWRDKDEGTLHVVLMACKVFSAFLHIHPFHDGNGRVGRLLLGTYLLRRGYPPPLFQNFDRSQYLDMLYRSQHGNPEDLYEWVLENVRDFLASDF